MSKTTSLSETLPAGLTAGGFAFEVVLAAADGAGEFAPPQWVQLTPRGRAFTRDGREFVFDPEHLAAQFAAGGLRLPIDFEHEGEFTRTLGAKPARAWIEQVEARPEGLFGRVDWLADAITALKAKAYRYISPTFWFEADGITARMMKAAALVASPALGMPSLASASHEQDTTMDKTVLAQLGLPETASAAEATAAIAMLKAGDPTKFVPIAQHEATQAALASAQAEIQTGKDAAQAALCATLVDDAVKAGKIAPAAREQYVALAAAAFDLTKATIAAMPVLLKAGEAETGDETGAEKPSTDAIALGAKAREYMDEQAAKGIQVSSAEAVAHLQRTAK